MSTNETLSRNDLLTDCERSMRYHQARARFFNALHLFIQFLIFAVSSVGVFQLLSAYLSEYWSIVLFAIIPTLALFSFVYNPVEKYYLHKLLHRDFTYLYGNIMSTPDAGKNTIANWTKEIMTLYENEPPVYRALLVHCENQVSIQLDKVKDGYYVDLSWHHKWFRNFCHFQSADFLNRNQKSAT